MKKKIVILGSTGSIGQQTLAVVENLPGRFEIVGLSTNSNYRLLLEQIKRFRPAYVVVSDREAKNQLRARNLGNTKLLGDVSDLVRLAGIDLVVNALAGRAGIIPTLETIKAGRDIALANKESLVAAGAVIMPLARKNGVNIYPIDSEHSAIWQCLRGEQEQTVRKLIITCSGGPFRGQTKKDLGAVTAAQALRHPTWKMGGKISIDSSTLMNKGLEVIEAYYLFGVSIEQIQVVVHPQSVVHSLVEFCDGSLKAQIGPPDMRLPIQYALIYPEREKLPGANFDLANIGQLNFSCPDLTTFPCLAYAYEALRAGGTMPAVLNAANEVAVELFLQNKIKFLDIPRLIRKAMDQHQLIVQPSFEQIISVGHWAEQLILGDQ